jgi:hypothetical protein
MIRLERAFLLDVDAGLIGFAMENQNDGKIRSSPISGIIRTKQTGNADFIFPLSSAPISVGLTL